MIQNFKDFLKRVSHVYTNSFIISHTDGVAVTARVLKLKENLTNLLTDGATFSPQIL